MKKVILTIFAFCMMVLPTITFASEKVDLSNYETLNFKEALAAEEMEEQFKNYTETDDQITIYLFRGQGCGYCRSFLTFLNSIAEEYGKYFKVVSFETWENQANFDLMNTLSIFLNEPAGGVPYIIIGDKVFPGYAADYDEDIKATIIALYNSDDRYDVVEAYNDSLNKSGSSNAGIVIWNFIFLAIATLIIVSTVKKSNARLLESIKEMTQVENTRPNNNYHHYKKTVKKNTSNKEEKEEETEE